MILMSGCLCGINCKYSGGNNINPKAVELVKQGKAIPVCPEQLGGLTTPREPCEIDELGRVISSSGEDKTEFFKRGAEETLKIAKLVDADSAILKSKSPSCGKCYIYDGSFTGKLKKGNGITVQLLLENNINIYSEEEIDLINL